MNEAETRAEHIDPALKGAGWGVVEGSKVHREHITLGRLEGMAGKRGKALTADYVLVYKGRKLGVIEAKAWDEPLTAGVGQAKNYAGKLAVRYAYATNGQGLYAIDMQTGAEGEIDKYPTPEELWAKTFAVENVWRNRFAAIPTPDKSGTWTIRFYQEIAVNRVLERIAEGGDKGGRALLTLATGTGKTSIAFQIAWKLYEARWNLRNWKNGEGSTLRPRILFLADRNTLANQAFNDFTSFAAFDDADLIRIAPDSIRKKGRVPTNGNIFFTIFQTFMSGPPKKGADGKERAIQHMAVTTFWHPDGTPMSAQQFMEMLFGKLPEFFKDEAELRTLWSVPDTRAKLLAGLAEKGFGHEQLSEMQKLIAAEKSDLFDVLAYVAYLLPPVTREERAAMARPAITAKFSDKQQAFLDFVLAQYIKVGVDELAQEKLSPLLKLKYHNAISDAWADLGPPVEVGMLFAGFQQYLYPG